MFTETIEIRPCYVHVQCSGLFDLDAFTLALNRGLDTAASGQRRAVLMNALALDGTLGKADRFVLGDGIAHAQRAHRFAAVIAVVANEPLLEPERFAEKVAIDRGAIGRSFMSLSDAEQWIKDYLQKFPDGILTPRR